MGAAQALGRAVLDFALPARCPGCGVVVDGDHRFCLDCWNSLTFLGQPACARCGAPFETDPGAGAQCGACLQRPPAFDSAAAAVAYGEVARTLALKLKYGRRPGIAKTIARQMERLLPDGGDPVLAPVPLHRWRIWTRGYNQAALIARALGQARGIALGLDVIERRRGTPPLRGMNPSERAKTVRGAFAVTEAGRARVAGRSVVLVDDVFTTGATVDACARVLRRAGAAEVRVICWARVVRSELAAP